MTPLKRLIETETGAEVAVLSADRIALTWFLLARRYLGYVKGYRDRVAALLSNYEEADIVFVAHSYGTWCLADVIENWTYRRGVMPVGIILCGSILPQNYPWISRWRHVYQRAREQDDLPWVWNDIVGSVKRLTPASPYCLLTKRASKGKESRPPISGLARRPSTLFILQVIDDPVLRQAIEKQLDRIEHAHRFTRAVSVGNPREFLQAEKEDQEMAEACKRLIKNCIICWNYLYLSQKLEEIEDAATRQLFLDAVAHGSVISWQHINLLGEYDFSDEKLQDNVGIRPPKLTP